MTNWLLATYVLLGLIILVITGKPRKLAQDWLFIALLIVFGAGLLAPFLSNDRLLSFALSNSLMVLTGPALLFYIRSVLGDWRYNAYQWMHSIPALLIFGIYAFIDEPIEEMLSLLKVFYLFIYLVYSARKYRWGIRNLAQQGRTLWFYLLFAGLGVLLLIGVASVLQAFFFSAQWLISETVMIPASLLFLFILTYAGVRYHSPFSQYAQGGIYSLQTPPPSESDKQILKAVFRDFNALLDEQQAHLDPEFTLKSASTMLGISNQLLSQAINENNVHGFSGSVARARVESFKRLLKTTNESNTNLLKLAMDCGFKSKSTFNRIIKQHTGVSPSELKDQLT